MKTATNKFNCNYGTSSYPNPPSPSSYTKEVLNRSKYKAVSSSQEQEEEDISVNTLRAEYPNLFEE
jgi:hypothetical protein